MVDLSQASSLKESTNIMISSMLKPHTNAHSICSRPRENVLERFMKGSLCGLYERSIYERTFLSERIENHQGHPTEYFGKISVRMEGRQRISKFFPSNALDFSNFFGKP